MVCPIAGYKIDEKTARVVAGFVVLATILGVVLPSSAAQWILVFLALDFGFRAFSRPRWSVLGRISAVLLKSIGVVPRLVDAGPKRFAARIGLLFSLSLVVLTEYDLHLAKEIVAGILLVCAALESFLGFCLGCQMWTVWYALLDRISGGRSNGREI